MCKEYFTYPDTLIDNYLEVAKNRYARLVADVTKGDLATFIKKIRKDPNRLKVEHALFSILPDSEKTLEVCKVAFLCDIHHIIYTPENIKNNPEYQEFILNAMSNKTYFRIGIELFCKQVSEDFAGAILLLKELGKNHD